MSPIEEQTQTINIRPIHQDATNNENGCQYHPLLHLLLRVIDVLLKNVINSAIGSDDYHTCGHGSVHMGDTIDKGSLGHLFTEMYDAKKGSQMTNSKKLLKVYVAFIKFVKY